MFGEVELAADGGRYLGFDTGVGSDWDAVVPVVIERSGWRGGANATTDLPLEVARRAVLFTEGPDRADLLTSLETVVSEVRVEQEARLAGAYGHHGLDWSAAGFVGEETRVRVALSGRVAPGDPDTVVLTAHVENHGDEPLHQVLVELSSGLGVWDGAVVPIGLVAPGVRGQGETTVSLPVGMTPREDVVAIQLHADGRPAIDVGAEVLTAASTSEPRLRVEVAVSREGEPRVVDLLVQNLSSVELSGVKVYFGSPEVPGVELVDRASAVPALAPESAERVSLGLQVDAAMVGPLPLRLNIDADRFGPLIEWDLQVPLDGSTLVVEAPRVVAVDHPLSAPVGAYTFPIEVIDDQQVRHVTVFFNDHKLKWIPVQAARMSARVELELSLGENRVRVVARDDLGLVGEREVVVRGELSEPAAAVE